MDQLKPYFDVVALIANVFAIFASAIAIYIFVAKRRELAQALQLLLNFSLQTTLSEVKEKLERLNEYNAAEPTDQDEIRNILHEIAGQIRGNRHLKSTSPELPERIELLARKLTEPKKRAMVSELRELLRGAQVSLADPFSGKNT